MCLYLGFWIISISYPSGASTKAKVEPDELFVGPSLKQYPEKKDVRQTHLYHQPQKPDASNLLEPQLARSLGNKLFRFLLHCWELKGKQVWNRVGIHAYARLLTRKHSYKSLGFF